MAALNKLSRHAIERVVLYGGLGLLGGLLLLGTAMMVVCRLVVPHRHRQAVGRWMPMAVFRIYLAALRATGMVRIDLTALDALRSAGAMVIAPNHPGLLDAVLVTSRLPNLTLIMKSELMANPFLGLGARMAGYIRNDSPRSMIRQSVDALLDGGQLLVFPEGTRTVTDPINPLKAAFALIARRAGVPIQLVIIETNSRFLGKGWPLWKRPDMPLVYRARLGPRIDPSDNTDETVARVREAFERELGARNSKPAVRSDTRTTTAVDA